MMACMCEPFQAHYRDQDVIKVKPATPRLKGTAGAMATTAEEVGGAKTETRDERLVLATANLS